MQNDSSVSFLLAGRNQRSIEIDFRSDEGADALWRLIDSADVLVENFRPGALDKRGLSYEAVSARNPGIVYCSLTGFGTVGPMRSKPGQDLLLQSLSGLAMLSGRAADPPMPVGSAIVDQHGVVLGAMGILAALLGRQRTGRGCRVDSNLLSAAMDLQVEPLNYHLNGAQLWDRSTSGISSRFHQAPYGVFQTVDGWLTISLSDGAALASAFEDAWFASLTRDDQFDRRETVNARVAEHMKNRGTEEWEEILTSNGIWFARVQNYDELLSNPQVEANQSIVKFDDPQAGTVRVLAHPVKYDGGVPPLRRTPPVPGQQTDEVMRELGFGESEITELRRSRVIGPDRAADGYDQSAYIPETSYSRKTHKPS